MSALEPLRAEIPTRAALGGSGHSGRAPVPRREPTWFGSGGEAVEGAVPPSGDGSRGPEVRVFGESGGASPGEGPDSPEVPARWRGGSGAEVAVGPWAARSPSAVLVLPMPFVLEGCRGFGGRWWGAHEVCEMGKTAISLKSRRHPHHHLHHLPIPTDRYHHLEKRKRRRGEKEIATPSLGAHSNMAPFDAWNLSHLSAHFMDTQTEAGGV